MTCVCVSTNLRQYGGEYSPRGDTVGIDTNGWRKQSPTGGVYAEAVIIIDESISR